MIWHKLTAEPNQSFYVNIGDNRIQINMRYVPAMRKWIAGITGVVEGVAVIAMVPIFEQYGYNQIFFYNSDDESIARDLSTSYIVIGEEEEMENIDHPYLFVDVGEVRIRDATAA